MRKVLTSFLFSLALVADAAAQENQDKSVADKTKDATVEGAKKAGDATKKGVNEVGDKAEDVGDATKKGAKKSGNWVKRTWRKIF